MRDSSVRVIVSESRRTEVMFFRKKLNRVLHVKEAEERFEKDIEKTPLEKKDRLAMVLAALIVFVPAVLLVVLVFALVLYFFFFRFL